MVAVVVIVVTTAVAITIVVARNMPCNNTVTQFLNVDNCLCIRKYSMIIIKIVHATVI